MRRPSYKLVGPYDVPGWSVLETKFGGHRLTVKDHEVMRLTMTRTQRSRVAAQDAFDLLFGDDEDVVGELGLNENEIAYTAFPDLDLDNYS